MCLSARQLLKTLLEQPLRFEKVEQEGHWGYRVVGRGVISRSWEMLEIR
jgi:hypothetical protein